MMSEYDGPYALEKGVARAHSGKQPGNHKIEPLNGSLRRPIFKRTARKNIENVYWAEVGSPKGFQ